MCFESSENVKKQGKDWFKKLHNFFHKSFKKVRFNGKIKETEMNKLFELRRKMVQDIKKCNDDSKNRLMEKLSDVESKITEKVLEENLLKIKKNFECLSNSDDLVNVNGMQSSKRKLFPKNRETLPFAKQNFNGKLITSQERLKTRLGLQCQTPALSKVQVQ